MFRSRLFWILCILILAGVGYSGYTIFNANQATEASAEDEIETTVVRRGDILISASGAGTVIPAEEIAVGFETGGILIELPVAVGVKVNEGEILARLHDADAQQALAQAELQLRQATAQQSIEEDLAISSSEINMAQAEIQVEIAQEALADLLNFEPDPDEIAIAEANLEAAQAGLNSAQGQSASVSYSLQVQQISVQQAERDMASAQESYNIAWDPARDWELQWDDPVCSAGQSEQQGNCSNTTYAEQIERERENTASALVRAQENLTIAQANFNSASINSASSTANAESSVLAAQQTLNRAKEGPTDDEIKAAERNLEQAELSLQQAVLNQANDALNRSISIEQAEISLQNAENDLEKIILRAPMSGTIMEIGANEGEQVSAGVLVTLANLEQPIIEIFIDETDLDKINVTNDVTVEFDAIPDIVFDGEIVAIDPQLTDQGGVTAIRAIVQLIPSGELPSIMPVGMNASVEVIGAQANDVLIVPLEALREISDGQFGLFVIEDEEPKFRMVDVGLQGFTFAEIQSGVAEGETVTTGIIQTE